MCENVANINLTSTPDSCFNFNHHTVSYIQHFVFWTFWKSLPSIWNFLKQKHSFILHCNSFVSPCYVLLLLWHCLLFTEQTWKKKQTQMLKNRSNACNHTNVRPQHFCKTPFSLPQCSNRPPFSSGSTLKRKKHVFLVVENTSLMRT